MNTNGYLAPDVDLSNALSHMTIDVSSNLLYLLLADLSAKTKNFTGAELEGLVKSAASFAFNRHIDANNLLKPDAPEKIKVSS